LRSPLLARIVCVSNTSLDHTVDGSDDFFDMACDNLQHQSLRTLIPLRKAKRTEF